MAKVKVDRSKPISTSPRSTLGERFDAHRNAVGFLRLAAAGLVLASHTFQLGGFGNDPLHAVTSGQEALGSLAVAVFFVLSGFLVTRSIIRSPGTWRFLRRRALRILPGYWVCLLTTAFGFGAVLWIHEHGTLAGFMGRSDGPLQYVGANWVVIIRQWQISGLLSHNPFGPGINGSLWTLIDEVRCYIVLAVLAAAGLIQQRRAPVLAALALFWWIGSVKPIPIHFGGALLPIYNHWLAVHFLAFTLGALAYTYRHLIPVNRAAALGAALAFIVTVATGTYSEFGLVPVAYLTLFLAVTLPATRISTTTDLSYGIYIYGFPVQQSLVAFGANRFGPAPFFAFAAAITVVLAWFSWRLVEKPAMRLR
jgi:peptidoglycan/LPS O-acetylase OafA/YrhL